LTFCGELQGKPTIHADYFLCGFIIFKLTGKNYT